MLTPEEIAYLKKLGQDSGIFYFKQFRVEDDHSTMKVGTDAVLLGITAQVDGAGNILEVGTGCGVISLLLAQRSKAMIDTIEADGNSVNQAMENARQSPWGDRITVYHKTFQEFVKASTLSYDVIVSNPPFFSRSFRSAVDRKNLSRHDDMLTFDELAGGSRKLLKEGGSLWVILPVREAEQFIHKAGQKGFHHCFTLEVIPKKGKATNRLVMQFIDSPCPAPRIRRLTLRDADNTFSREYMEYAHDYYIDF